MNARGLEFRAHCVVHQVTMGALGASLTFIAFAVLASTTEVLVWLTELARELGIIPDDQTISFTTETLAGWIAASIVACGLLCAVGGLQRPQWNGAVSAPRRSRGRAAAGARGRHRRRRPRSRAHR